MSPGESFAPKKDSVEFLKDRTFSGRMYRMVDLLARHSQNPRGGCHAVHELRAGKAAHDGNDGLGHVLGLRGGGEAADLPAIAAVLEKPTGNAAFAFAHTIKFLKAILDRLEQT